MPDLPANYFVMTCEDIDEPTALEDSPSLGTGPWNSGKPIRIDVPNPLEYELDPGYPGDMMPYYRQSIPVMRNDLIDALRAAGVDNLELFPAVIRDTEEEKDFDDYQAFNIVGVVAAADMKASQLMGTSDSEMIDADFDRLVLDDEKVGGLLMFRLAEAVNAVVVHAKVRKSIEDRGIPGMTFYGPGEWAG